MSAIPDITPSGVVPARPLLLEATSHLEHASHNDNHLADLDGLLRSGDQGKRVALALALVQVEINRRGTGTSSGAAATSYRDIAVALAQRGAFDQAWTAVKAADRELLETYDADELRAEAARLTREAAAKLKGWRADHVRALLGANTPQTGGPVVSARTVIECRRVLDDAADTAYRKLSLLRRRLRSSALSLIGTLLLVMAAWLAAAGAGVEPVRRSGLLEHWSSLLVVLSLGALGAALSGLLSMRDRMIDARVPDLNLNWILLVWRPVIGAASAFAVVLVLQSGVAGVALDSSAALVTALIAGTTEQVVTHAIGRAGAMIKQGTAGSATAPAPQADRDAR